MIFPLPFLFLYFFLSVLTLFVGTYTDLKERIISNKLTYSMIFLGVMLHAIQSLAENNLYIIVITATVTGAGFFFAWILWKLGAWAGGDVKLFTALAALNPLNYAFLRELIGLKIELLSSVSFPVFPLTLFIFTIFAMIPYGAFIALKEIIKRKELRQKYLEDFRKSSMHSIEFAFLLVGLNGVITPLKLDAVLYFISIIALLLLYGKPRIKFKQIVPLVLFGYAFWAQGISAAYSLAYVLVFFLIVYFMMKLYSISKSEVLKKKVKISELKEGMIPAESLVEADGKIEKRKTIGIKTIIKYFANNRLDLAMELTQPKGREIISARKARGLTEEEISELKKLEKEKKIDDSLTVKLSAPMVPAVLIAFLVLSLVGDILWNLLFA